MSNYSNMYWLTRLNPLHNFASGSILALAILIGMYLFFRGFAWVELEKDECLKIDKKAKWPLRFGISIIILMVLIRLFVPTKGEMVFIIAGGKTIDFIQSDTSINKIPSQTTAVISKFLDEQIKDLSKQ
jgi:hypothetical protein